MSRTGHIPYTPNAQANHTAIVKEVQDLLRRVSSLETGPKITGDLNMQGRRITNVGLSKDTGDVPARGELIARGLFEDAQGNHVAHSNLVVEGNIRSRKQAREPFDLVPFWQLRQYLQTVLTTFTLGVRSLTLTNGQNNNVQIGQPPSAVYTITGPTADFSVSGFIDGTTNQTGRLVVLVNPTGFPLTILDRTNGASVATNRIATNKGWDMQTQTDGVAIFCYVASVWRVLATVL